MSNGYIIDISWHRSVNFAHTISEARLSGHLTANMLRPTSSSANYVVIHHIGLLLIWFIQTWKLEVLLNFQHINMLFLCMLHVSAQYRVSYSK